MHDFYPAFAPSQKRTGFRKAPPMGGTLREFFLCICTIADRLSAASLKNLLHGSFIKIPEKGSH